MFLKKKTAEKQLAVLIDPDNTTEGYLGNIFNYVDQFANCIDYFFVGGSLIIENRLDEIILRINENCSIPVVLFPGSPYQISTLADGILLLSVISGRNPEMLIGSHVVAAPMLKKSNLEILSTGYILVNSGDRTSVEYMSNTIPIPADKPEIAVATAMAGEMLGLKLLYLDGGSGVNKPIGRKVIQQVSSNTNVPLIVGGGINTANKAKIAWESGADIVVVGNGLQNDNSLLEDIFYVKQKFNHAVSNNIESR